MVNADSTEQQSVIQKYLRAMARTRDRLIMLYILMEADSTEQLSLIQEYKDLANLPLMGKGEDQIEDSMDFVYNREEKQAMSATAQVSEDQSVAKTDKQTSQDTGLYPVAMGEVSTECSRLTQKQDEDSVLPKPGTEPSPVLACDSSDDYLAVCDRKSELVLDIDPRSCQRKWTTKTKTEYYSDISKKCRVIPREDGISDPEENWFQVSSEICQDSFNMFCLIHFYLDNLFTIFRSVFRDVLEGSFGQVPHGEAGKDIHRHVITQERVNMMEDRAAVAQAMPREDCSAILRNECITDH